MKIGKTEFLVAELLESVNAGQPRSIVVAHTEAYARELQNRFGAAASARNGFCSIMVRQGGRTTIDGEQIIDFMGVSRATSRRTLCGPRGTGWFWDHAVFDHYPDYLLRDALETIDIREGINWREWL